MQLEFPYFIVVDILFIWHFAAPTKKDLLASILNIDIFTAYLKIFSLNLKHVSISTEK